MTTKRIENTSWVEVVIAISLYTLVLIALAYFIFSGVEQADHSVEFLKLVDKAGKILPGEPPIDIGSNNDCNGSNFDYRDWVGTHVALKHRN